MEFILIIVAVVLVLTSLKESGRLLQFFLICFSLIYFSRPLLYLFTGDGVYTIYKFKRLSLSFSEVLGWHAVILCSLVGLILGNKRLKFRPRLRIMDVSESSRVVLNMLLFIFYPVYLLFNIREFQFLRDKGYLLTYTGEYEESLTAKMVGYVMLVLFAIAFSRLKLSRVRFILLSTAYVLPNFVISIYGARGDFVLSLVLVIWLAHKRGLGFSRKYMALFALPLVPITYLILVNRYVVSDFYFLMQTLLMEIGNSSLIIPYSNYVGLPGFWDTPMLLAPFQLNPFQGQSLSYLDHTWGLGHHLTSALSRVSYLNGEGIGSSFIAELNQIGLLAVFLGSALLGAVIRVLDDHYSRSYIVRIYSFILVPHIVFISRTSFFPPAIVVIIFTFIFLLYFTLCQVIKR